MTGTAMNNNIRSAIQVCEDVDCGSGVKCRDDNIIEHASWCDQCKIEYLCELLEKRLQTDDCYACKVGPFCDLCSEICEAIYDPDPEE
jgi:hypothetical protein